jgi:hypothetical protein
MRFLVALLGLVLVPSWAKAEALRVFTDRGSTWVRSDDKKLLQVGAELDARVEESGPSVGKAVIMEVNGMLARVALDEAATAAKAKVLVSGSGRPMPAPANATPPAPRPASKNSTALSPPPLPTPGNAPATRNTLKGRLVHAPIRMQVFNDSNEDWTACTLRYSDGTSYGLSRLPAHADEGILKVKFGFAPTTTADRVSVTCAQGQSMFVFGRSSGTGTLKGRADGRDGRIFVSNDSEENWSNCEIRKPDGTRFMMGTLKAHDTDGIANGRFKTPDNELVLSIDCDQGHLETKVNGPRLP